MPAARHSDLELTAGGGNAAELAILMPNDDVAIRLSGLRRLGRINFFK